MNFAQLNGKSIRDAFTEYHNANPKVFQAFEQIAFKAINAGKKKISAKLVINYIRWNMFMETTDSNFKINDAFGALYGRLFIAIHPEHADKFECRKLRNEEFGPYMVEENGQLKFL